MLWDGEERRVAHGRWTCHMQAPGIKNTHPANDMQSTKAVNLCQSRERMVVIKTGLMMKTVACSNQIISPVNLDLD